MFDWYLSFHCTERSGSKFGWSLGFLVLAALVGAGIAGYIFYKYRLRVMSKKLHSSYIHHIHIPVSSILALEQQKLNRSSCSLTWTQRSWPSCHSTCLLTTTTTTTKSQPRPRLCDQAHQYEEGMMVLSLCGQINFPHAQNSNVFITDFMYIHSAFAEKKVEANGIPRKLPREEWSVLPVNFQINLTTPVCSWKWPSSPSPIPP